MEPCDGNITTYCLEEDSITGGSGSLHVGVATAIIKALALQFFQRSSTSTSLNYVVDKVWRRGLGFDWNGTYIEFDWLIRVVRAHQVSMGIIYGTFTVMLWDMFLTFSDEVAFIWPARFSFVKIVFLFNRYVTPIVIAVNLWTLSGHARNLSATVLWFTLALLIESLSISCVSLVVALRLYAFQVATRRVFLFLLALWALTFVSTLGLLIRNFLLRMDAMRFITSGKYSTCTGQVIDAWTSWLPLTLEHGLLCVFLFLNALKTPRSSQTALLAIMYRQGIFFYAITFTLFFFALIMFRFMSLMWFLLPLYMTWILCQIFMSRLLIGVKTTQAFENFVPQLHLSTIAMKPRPSAHYHVPYPPHLQRQAIHHQHHHHQHLQSQTQQQLLQSQSHSQLQKGRGEERSPSAQSFRPSSLTEIGTRASPMPSKAAAASGLHPYDSDPEIMVVPNNTMEAVVEEGNTNCRRMSVNPQYPPPTNALSLSDDSSPSAAPKSRSFLDRLPWWMRIGSVWQSVGGAPGGGVVGWGAVGPGGVTAVGLGGMDHHHRRDLHVDIDCCDESDHDDVDDTIGNEMGGDMGDGSEGRKEQKKTRGGLRVSKLGRYDYWL
ncbi:hypothetical protein CPB86DRAFT_787430 [Serendipita vermifera]|nr:hypothetical protein CPB86DRAFT_787430 [Serendipita vermifera]